MSVNTLLGILPSSRTSGTAAQIRDPSKGSETLRWIPDLRCAPSGMTEKFGTTPRERKGRPC